MVRLLKSVFVLIVCIAAFGVVRAHAATPILDVGKCAKDFKLPPFSSLAQSTLPEVNVSVSIHIDGHGQIASLDFEGGQQGHHDDIRLAIGDSSFNADCFGKTLVVKFTYEINGPPTYDPQTTVRFRSPNHFILHANPLLPIAEHVKPKSKR